jgi:glycolate oxidase FAD binding subunit
VSSEGTAAPAAVNVPPDDVEVVSPTSDDELSGVLREATAERRTVAVWGGGTHRAVGYEVRPDRVISTAGMSGVVDWQPDDLTVVVAAGTPVADLEEELNRGRQTAVLPEWPGAATVGGVVATGTSSYARLRYGPTRDRVLEVRAVTGDGRVVKGGGRVVKNVTGYDLPRLYTGSLGSLGVITSVCLKLWPLTEATRTVFVEAPPPDTVVYRPRAVLQTDEDVRVFLAGTGREVDEQVRRIGGEERDGLQYPPSVEGEAVWSLRVPPGVVGQAVGRLPPGRRFVAQHGVGEVTFEAPASFDVTDLRAWAEAEGGALVRLRGHSEADPWGTPPPGLELQRRIVAAFDPARILEPGRLPGGL